MSVLPPDRDFKELSDTLASLDGDKFTLYEYVHGARQPHYPVPAHRYSVLFQQYSVQMVIGITKQWYPRFPEPFVGPYIDCELVQMWTDYPKDLFS